MRHALRRRDTEPPLAPNRLIRELTSLGVITQSDQSLLERCLEFRNRVVHGFRAGEIPVSLAHGLAGFAQRLLEAGETVDDTFDFQNVSRWIQRSLSGYEGYQVDDEIFARDAVVLRGPNDSMFLVTLEDWTDLEAAERSRLLGTRLREWADAHLPQNR